jgi:hypothetical protein
VAVERFGTQAGIAYMRGLLSEMGGLSALGASGGTVEQTAGGSKVWNESLGFISAGYVKDRCVELLSVEDDRVPQALTDHLDELERKLAAAATGEAAWYPLDDRLHSDHEQTLRDNYWAVYDQYQAMFPEVQKLVNSLVPPTGLTWKQTRAALRKQTQPEIKRLVFVTQTGGVKASDELAVALSALLTAVHQYLDRYINTKKLMTWTDV